jgi:hypothetical protein
MWRQDSSMVIGFTAATSLNAGFRFNPHKLLVDPYAKELTGRLVWSDAHFGYRAGSVRADLSFDRRDNARGMPKGVVIDPAFTWGEDRRLSIPWEDTIIYEAHVKGLTHQFKDVPPAWRGTFRALAAPAVISHLQRLGVTAIELLPDSCVPRRSDTWSNADLITIGGTTHSAFLLPPRATPWKSRSRSFVRPSHACMMPASRSSSTSSTIIRPRAIISAQR